MTSGVREEKEPTETNVVKWLYPGAAGTVETGGHSSSQGDTTSVTSDMDSELQTDQSVQGSDGEHLAALEKSSPTTSGPDSEVGSLDDLPKDRNYISEDLSKQVAAASNYVGSFFSASSWRQSNSPAQESTENDEDSENVKNTKNSSIMGGSFLSAFGAKVPGFSKVSPTEDENKTNNDNDKETAEKEESSSGSFFSSAFNKMGISNMTSSITMENISGKMAAAAGATYPDTPPAEVSEAEAKENDVDRKTEEGWSYNTFSSALTKASKAAADYTKVIQDSVAKAPMLAEFNNEQEEFIRSKGDKEQPTAPWSGYQNENELREKVIALSEDKRNFLRSPPAGVNFDFEYSAVAAHALVLLEEDPRLRQMRYELVPKKVKEDEFWRNYFYRVGLVKQSFELSNSMATDSHKEKKTSLPGPLEDDDNLNPSGADQDDEFVSELHQASSKDLAEADEAMRKLGLSKNDAEWEAELEGELNEYEMVGEDGEGDTNPEDNPEWEDQIQEMLDAESKK